ncbi:MAG: YlbF family regulator [Lachnospiraceae bacterium]|nr:YlbF family regulator [Lachnospiraceae bacterium]
MELEEKAKELSEMILKSDIYKRYINAKEELEKDTDLLGRVGEYRRKNFQIQMEANNNKRDALKGLESEYYETLSQVVVKEFLDAELILCRKIQKINNIIIDKIDFDMNFIS